MQHLTGLRTLMFIVGLGVAAGAQMPAPISSADGPVYVGYYWRAKPGQLEAYNQYIRSVAEPIDESARQSGVFEEVVTVTPVQKGTSVIPVDWTHLRIFKLKNLVAVEGLSKGLDAATERVVPDEGQRRSNSERSAGLRDFVRQEIWTTLR